MEKNTTLQENSVILQQQKNNLSDEVILQGTITLHYFRDTGS